MQNLGIAISTQSTIVIAIVCVLYILTITAFGGYFARFNKNINDFFYSGQRFSWWVPAASMVATGIGSYSYLKYSEQGFKTGMSSAITYTNDWFIIPFFIFGWLPIIYFSKIKSIPEYFERRFNSTARYISLTILMAYMLFYIGYNLYTIGIALEGMFGISLAYSTPLVAIFLGAYVTFGGQTAVIFTDLFQGILLYIAGGIAIYAALSAVGGFGEWWSYLPETHRLPFTHLTENPKFNTAGLFWGEALAGSIAFTFMNQGFIMRYLSIKSVSEGRKAGIFNVLVTLPLSAIVVGAVGWIGKSIIMKQTVTGGALAGLNFIEIENTFHTFLVICWETIKHNPWIFGVIIAALLAALMSTIDTLINACAAVIIYDLYKPLIKKKASDAHYLIAARWSSVGITILGLILVLWFHHTQTQGGVSLMSLHYKGIMIIIPSIVTTIFLGAFWSRFNAKAACISMLSGSVITLVTVWYPSLIDGVAGFVSGPQNGIYIYMRALFGMVATAVIGIVVTLLTAPPKRSQLDGLTLKYLEKGIISYKGGGKPNYEIGEKLCKLETFVDSACFSDVIEVSENNMKRLKACDGDLVYLCDDRWYLGGLRSTHINIKTNLSLNSNQVRMTEKTFNEAYLLNGRLVMVEKII